VKAFAQDPCFSQGIVDLEIPVPLSISPNENNIVGSPIFLCPVHFSTRIWLPEVDPLRPPDLSGLD
jgi:hypothetical protein